MGYYGYCSDTATRISWWTYLFKNTLTNISKLPYNAMNSCLIPLHDRSQDLPGAMQKDLNPCNFHFIYFIPKKLFQTSTRARGCCRHHLSLSWIIYKHELNTFTVLLISLYEVSGELWKCVLEWRLSEPGWCLVLPRRHFITIKFQPAACFLLSHETKAHFFFFSFFFYTHSVLFLLVISIKPGVWHVFSLGEAITFDKSFRLPARPFCYYKKKKLTEISFSLSFSLSFSRPLDSLSPWICCLLLRCLLFLLALQS